MNYVGIKACKEKRAAIRRKGTIRHIPVSWLLTGDTERHQEFCKGNEIPYRLYYSSRGKSHHYIEAKCKKFHKLIESFKKNGYVMIKPLVVSENGIRIDGSHRAAVMKHFGYNLALVRVVKMDMTPDLEQHLQEQRRAYCL